MPNLSKGVYHFMQSFEKQSSRLRARLTARAGTVGGEGMSFSTGSSLAPAACACLGARPLNPAKKLREPSFIGLRDMPPDIPSPPEREPEAERGFVSLGQIKRRPKPSWIADGGNCMKW